MHPRSPWSMVILYVLLLENIITFYTITQREVYIKFILIFLKNIMSSSLYLHVRNKQWVTCIYWSCSACHKGDWHEISLTIWVVWINPSISFSFSQVIQPPGHWLVNQIKPFVVLGVYPPGAVTVAYLNRAIAFNCNVYEHYWGHKKRSPSETQWKHIVVMAPCHVSLDQCSVELFAYQEDSMILGYALIQMTLA